MNKKKLTSSLILAVFLFCGIAVSGCKDSDDDDNGAPAPTNLQANAGGGSITLTWNPVSGYRYYAVYRSAESDWSEFVCLTSSWTNTVYTDNSGTLTAGTKYYYKVAAVNWNDNAIGAQSQAAEATLDTSSGITTTKASVVSGTSIKITWNAVEGAAKYKVYRAAAYFNVGGGEEVAIVIAPATEYTDTGLTAGTQYYYRIASIDSNGFEGAQSSSYTSATPIAVPTDLSATLRGLIITLKWKAVPLASSYYVYGAFEEDGDYGLIDSISASVGTVYNVSTMSPYSGVPLEKGTTYYFKVAASLGGEMSAVVSATTGP